MEHVRCGARLDTDRELFRDSSRSRGVSAALPQFFNARFGVRQIYYRMSSLSAILRILVALPTFPCTVVCHNVWSIAKPCVCAAAKEHATHVYVANQNSLLQV